MAEYGEMETGQGGLGAKENPELQSALKMKFMMEKQLVSESINMADKEQLKDAYSSLCDQIALIEGQAKLFQEDEDQQEPMQTTYYSPPATEGNRQHRGGGNMGSGGRQQKQSNQRGRGNMGRRGGRGGNVRRGGGRQQQWDDNSQWSQGGGEGMMTGRGSGRGGPGSGRGGFGFGRGGRQQQQGEHFQPRSFGRGGHTWQDEQQQPSQMYVGRGGHQWQEPRGRPHNPPQRGGLLPPPNAPHDFPPRDAPHEFPPRHAGPRNESESQELRSLLHMVRRLVSKRPGPPGQFGDREPKRRRPDWMEPPRGPGPYDRSPRGRPLLPRPMLSPPPPPPREFRPRPFPHGREMFEREQRWPSQSDDNMKYCALCNVKAGGEIPYNLHVSGRRHKQTVATIIAKAKFPEFGDTPVPTVVLSVSEDRKRNSTEQFIANFKERGLIIHDLADPETKEDAMKRCAKIESDLQKVKKEIGFCYICLCDIGKPNYANHSSGYKHNRMADLGELILKTKDAVEENDVEKVEELAKKYRGMITPKPSDEDKWFCTVCEAPFDTEDNYKYHIPKVIHNMRRRCLMIIAENIQFLYEAMMKAAGKPIPEYMQLPEDEEVWEEEKRNATEVFVQGISNVADIIKDLGDPEKKDEAIIKANKVKEDVTATPEEGNSCAVCECSFGRSNAEIHNTGYKHLIMKELSDLVVVVKEAVEKEDLNPVTEVLQKLKELTTSTAGSDNEWMCFPCNRTHLSEMDYGHHVETVVHHIRARCLAIKTMNLAKLLGKEEQEELEESMEEEGNDEAAEVTEETETGDAECEERDEIEADLTEETEGDETSGNIDVQSGQDDTETPSGDIEDEDKTVPSDEAGNGEQMEVGEKEKDEDDELLGESDNQGDDVGEEEEKLSLGKEDEEDKPSVDKVGDEVKKQNDKFAVGYMSDVVTGQTYITPGFSCLICEEFISDPEFAFYEHCRSTYHCGKLRIYENRLKEYERRKLHNKMLYEERMQRGGFQREGLSRGGMQRGGMPRGAMQRGRGKLRR